MPGGQWISAAAPIDHIPLFVRAGSIVPIGVQIPSTATRQSLETILVYPGRSTRFTLYDDDGVSNSYRSANGTTVLQWDDASARLTKAPGAALRENLAGLIKVIGR